MYNVKMYVLEEMARTTNHTYEEYFEFELVVDTMSFRGTATYGEIGEAHENSRNLLVHLESNDVLFLDILEVDELAEKMFELEPDPDEEIYEEFELDDIVEEVLDDEQ